MCDEGVDLVAADASVSQCNTQLSADADVFFPSASSSAVAAADTATATGGQQQFNDPAIIASFSSARSSASPMTQSRVVDDVSNTLATCSSSLTSPSGGYLLSASAACSPVDVSLFLHQQHQQQQQHWMAGTWQGPGRPASNNTFLVQQPQPCFTSSNVPSQETYQLPLTQYPFSPLQPAAYLVPAQLSNYYRHHQHQQQLQHQSYQFLSPVESNSPDTFVPYVQPFSPSTTQSGRRILVGHPVTGFSDAGRPGASAAAAAGGSQLQRMVDACSPLSDCSRSRHCHHHHHCSKTETKDKTHRRDRVRKKMETKSCGVNKVNVGVQYEAEDKQNIYSQRNCQDCDTQTDFPDDLAKSLLLDVPSPLYVSPGDSSADQDETDYCSTDSAELDSDSGYGTHRYRHSRSTGFCQRCCATLARQHHQYLTCPPQPNLSVVGGGYQMQPAAAALPGSSVLYLVPKDAPPLPSTLTQPPPSTPATLVTRQTTNVRSAAGTPMERAGKRSGRRGKRGSTATAVAAGVDAGTTTNTPSISGRKTSSTAVAPVVTAEISQLENHPQPTSHIISDADDSSNVSTRSSLSQQPAAAVGGHLSHSEKNNVRKNRHREAQRNKSADAECMEIVREQDALVERYFGHDGVPYSETGDDVMDFDLADERRRNIHSQLFRNYCTQLINREINDCCLKLLLSIFSPHNESPTVDLGSTADPDQQLAGRRAVIGLREVVKHLSMSRLLCIIIAPNIDQTESKELDETLTHIVRTSDERRVTVVFALGRKSLGRACCKPVPVSIVGITTNTDNNNNNNTQKCLEELLILVARERLAYRKLVSRVCQTDSELRRTLDNDTIDEHQATDDRSRSTELDLTASPENETSSSCQSHVAASSSGKPEEENVENVNGQIDVLQVSLKCSAADVRHLNGFSNMNGLQSKDGILTGLEITVENRHRDSEPESTNSTRRISCGVPDFIAGVHMNGKPGIDADDPEDKAPAQESRISPKDVKCFTNVETAENDRHQRHRLQWIASEPERITDSVC